jgi:GNAT superfamily N-acetyltransferase
LPGEGLTPDELLACCWDDDGVVLGCDDGRGAVSAVVREAFGRRVGYVRALSVAPEAQGTGVGRMLLAAAESWLWSEGAEEAQAGPSAPFYLWPGIDVRWTRALCLFESAGYDPIGAGLNMSCPTTYRTRPPEGVAVERALEPSEVDDVLDLVARHWPHWVPETRRGIEHGACFAAREDGGVVRGFACHSVNRAGWIGPMGTDPDVRHHGLGGALLAALLRDLRVAGFADAEIAWVGPVGFYARTAGASVSRTFRQVQKRRPSG